MSANPTTASAAASRLVAVCLLAAAWGCGRATPEEPASATIPDHLGRAEVFYNQGNYQRAAEMCLKALEMDPASGDACLKLGIIYDDNLKDKGRAAYYYREYLRLQPDSDKSARVREWLEEVLAESGSGPRARRPAKKPPPPVAGPPSRRPSPPPVLPAPTDLPAPPAPAPSPRPAAGSAADSYTVRGGDTLAGIARRLYGDPNAWNRIFEANRDQLKSPHSLKVGQVLVIPR